VNTLCDFDTFVQMVYGTINQMKKIALLSFEFPELYTRLEYFTIYFRSKSVNYFFIKFINFLV
jgi:hypothetical protein